MCAWQELEHKQVVQLAHLMRDAKFEAPLSTGGGELGCRLNGIDLRKQLTAEQAQFFNDCLPRFRVVCVSNQQISADEDDRPFSLRLLERFANHFGAPVPHPNNFMRGGKPAQGDGSSDGEIVVLPYQKRPAAMVDAFFGPARLRCLEHESPAVLTVCNVGPAHAEHEGPVRIVGGGSW